MHSFLISETFKYLCFIFGDDDTELPLDKWVLDTVAHSFLVTPTMSVSKTKRVVPVKETNTVRHDES